jgi:hypothetical protein
MNVIVDQILHHLASKNIGTGPGQLLVTGFHSIGTCLGQVLWNRFLNPSAFGNRIYVGLSIVDVSKPGNIK